MTQTRRPDLMSFYIPHVDVDISFETVANIVQNMMEIGEVDRIEAVPKVNQTDGHHYHSCFVYLKRWFNGYNAQHLRNQIVNGKETKLFYMKHRYWKLFANTSPVASLPMPTHFTLELYIPSYYSHQVTLDQVAELFHSLELGSVSGIRYKNQYATATTSGYAPLIVDFNYWYHSENCHQFQLDLSSNSTVSMEPCVDDYPDMQWIVSKYTDVSIVAPVENPYLYYHTVKNVACQM
jgi:hypothetical protein